VFCPGSIAGARRNRLALKPQRRSNRCAGKRGGGERQHPHGDAASACGVRLGARQAGDGVVIKSHQPVIDTTGVVADRFGEREIST